VKIRFNEHLFLEPAGTLGLGGLDWAGP